MPPARLNVLFIGGYARSGTTLLDRTLGRLDGFISTGELGHIWQEGLKENRLCGCGIRFRECPFWTGVMDAAFGGMDGVDLAGILDLKSSADRWWRLPLVRRARLPRDLALYAGTLGKLYRAIQSVSGCRVLVDSTKDAAHAYLLGALRRDLDLSTVHLVRDSRGVVHSHRRQKYDPGTGRPLEPRGTARTSLDWDVSNVLMAVVARLSPRHLTLRYEDFVGDPQGAVDALLALLRLPSLPLPFGPDGTLPFGVDHTVGGNPVRFSRGPVSIRPDEEWRSGLPLSSRLATIALTWPLLFAFGYR